MEDLLETIKKARREKWTVLDLSKQDLTGLPVEICTLTHLKSLNIPS
jgi:hypothetical protein